MPHIFISYSRKNQRYVRGLAEDIRQRGFDVWLDDRIDYGDRWWRTIVKAIEDCAAFVVVMSPDAEKSEWVEREVLLAQREGKPIFPVLLEGKEFALLITTQFVDVTGGKLPADDFYDRIAAVITPAQVSGAWITPPKQNIIKPMAYVIGIFVLVAVIVIGAIMLTNLSGNDNATPTTAVAEMPSSTSTLTDNEQSTAIAEANSELTALAATATPTDTHEPTLTPTATATNQPTVTASATLPPPPALSNADATLTAIFDEIAAATATQAALLAPTETQYATETLIAQATATQYAVETEVQQGILNATATQYVVQTEVLVRLATAITWTPTPTLTYTPTNTPTPTSTPTASYTPTPTPTLSSEQLALTPVARNADWTPVERNFDGITMVLVPAGCFMMGSENGDTDEKPVHQQCFDAPFWIDKYEVTNAQYGSSGCESSSSDSGQPRNCVNWFDAQDFCKARGGRLPTEAEWEYAARGPDSLVYPWGNAYDAALVIDEDDATYGDTRTAPVGSRPSGASWVRALDMSGNVWEWVSTIYQAYPYNIDKELESNNNNTSLRVMRGGSFDGASYVLSTTVRGWFDPVYGDLSLGFRCARSS